VRGRGESYSDVILRHASDAKPAGGSPGSFAVPFPRRMSEANDEPPAALSGGVKTDAEGVIRPTYNAGGASGAMRRRNFHRWDTNETLSSP
jgi:hypothetical protein